MHTCNKYVNNNIELAIYELQYNHDFNYIHLLNYNNTRTLYTNIFYFMYEV